jgi:hypothetical protein
VDSGGESGTAAVLLKLHQAQTQTEKYYFKAHDLDAILSAHKEELHQFFIGLYGDRLSKSALGPWHHGPSISSIRKGTPVYHIPEMLTKV